MFERRLANRLFCLSDRFWSMPAARNRWLARRLGPIETARAARTRSKTPGDSARFGVNGADAEQRRTDQSHRAGQRYRADTAVIDRRVNR